MSFSEIVCSDNEEYLSCARAENEKTCLSELTGESLPVQNETYCMEGCYCKEGFMADGDRCVEKDQCGCLHMGIYYAVSQQ